jgi:hypothetical protein
VLALVETLVPDRYRLPPSRVRHLVDRATGEEPGVLREYQDGVRLLDERARRRGAPAFAALLPDQRDALLDDLLWRYGAEDHGMDRMDRYSVLLARRLERVRHSGPVRRFRQLVVRDLLRRMYEAAVPLVIGYANLPGVAGNARDYVTPPDA